MTDNRYVIPPPPQAAIAVAGSDKVFPVRRIWCVGRNYVEHIREMGQDERLPPFDFAKHPDTIVPDGGTVPPAGAADGAADGAALAMMKKLAALEIHNVLEHGVRHRDEA